MFSKNSLFKITHSSRVVLKKLTPFNKLNRNKGASLTRIKRKKNKHSCANLFKITHSTGMTLKKRAGSKGVRIDLHNKQTSPLKRIIAPL